MTAPSPVGSRSPIAMPRGDWALGLALAGLTIATRWPYHLRLGEPRPAYLAPRALATMAAVAERRVPLPPATRRLVWVVDEWPPGLPRPAALEARPVPHGRSLYVLRIRRRAVDHAGYHLVPATSVAHLP